MEVDERCMGDRRRASETSQSGRTRGGRSDRSRQYKNGPEARPGGRGRPVNGRRPATDRDRVGVRSKGSRAVRIDRPDPTGVPRARAGGTADDRPGGRGRGGRVGRAGPGRPEKQITKFDPDSSIPRQQLGMSPCSAPCSALRIPRQQLGMSPCSALGMSPCSALGMSPCSAPDQRQPRPIRTSAGGLTVRPGDRVIGRS